MAEREEISRGLARGDSCRQIAVDVERSHTTISREVNRNGGRKRYRAQTAEASTWQRARRAKPCKLALNAPLRAVVEEKLGLLWSPQQIAGWLGRSYPMMGRCASRTRRSTCRCLCRRAALCAVS
jgi:IS30 family transposase